MWQWGRTGRGPALLRCHSLSQVWQWLCTKGRYWGRLAIIAQPPPPTPCAAYAPLGCPLGRRLLFHEGQPAVLGHPKSEALLVVPGGSRGAKLPLGPETNSHYLKYQTIATYWPERQPLIQ